MADYLTTADVAALTGYSVRTVHRWIRAGQLTPVMKLPGTSGAYLFSADSVAAQRAERKPAPSRPPGGAA